MGKGFHGTRTLDSTRSRASSGITNGATRHVAQRPSPVAPRTTEPSGNPTPQRAARLPSWPAWRPRDLEADVDFFRHARPRMALAGLARFGIRSCATSGRRLGVQSVYFG